MILSLFSKLRTLNFLFRCFRNTTTLILRLIADMISQRTTNKTALSGNNVGSGKSTLRLRSKGPATVEAMVS